MGPIFNEKVVVCSPKTHAATEKEKKKKRKRRKRNVYPNGYEGSVWIQLIFAETKNENIVAK